MLRNATYVAIALFLASSYVYLKFMGIEQALFVSIFLGCASGTVKDTRGPSVSEAQAVSAVGPKARIAVALKNISGGPE